MAPRHASTAAEAASGGSGRCSSLQQTATNVVQFLQPGSFVKLRNQPDDLPPFELIRCRGGRCWVRQQAWGCLVQWEVEHRRLTAVA